jgi:hypothetical protein
MPLMAQNATFFLSPKWHLGDSHRFELTKGKQIFKEDNETIENQSRQTVTMTVVETSAKGSIVSARYENMFNSTETIEVLYAVGQNGDFQTITNMPIVRQSFDNIFENLNATAATTPSVLKSVQELQRFMTSDAYLTNHVFKELTQIHQFYNNTFTVDSLERYETELPNLLNPTGANIPARATLLAKREENIVYIRHTVEPDVVTINQQAKHFMNRMSGSSSSKLSVEKPPVVLADVALFDENFCSFDVKTGWVAAFQRKRTILEGDVKTVEFVFLKEIK